MKKSKFTEEQIVGILRETDRDPVSTVAKRHGVSEQAIYTWKKRFGSFQPDDVRRLKQLEEENEPLCARIKRLERPLVGSRVTRNAPRWIAPLAY
jgi:putative transposase